MEIGGTVFGNGLSGRKSICIKKGKEDSFMFHAAVIGTGNIAPSHIEGLLEFPDRCKIAALCDIYPYKAEKLKEKYGLECKIYEDYRQMLDDIPQIDLVHVCTPPYTHAELAIYAMDRGKNVVVEKPMAACLKECDAMLEAKERNQVTLSCIAQNRFRNSVYKLKQVADSGLAGKIRCAHVNSYWWRGHCYYDLWWRGLWEKEGGGPTLNHAVHHIDMLNWFEGRLPVEVMAMLANVMHDNSEVEDLSLAALRYEDGSVAQVTSSVVHHGEEQGIELQCADAKISSPWSLKAEISKSNGFPVEKGNTALLDKITTFYESLPDLRYVGHTGQIDNILSSMEEGKQPFITGEDGRKTVELITAIYEAGCKKRNVKLPIGKDDPFYTFEGILENAVHFYRKAASVENMEDSGITVGNYK